FEDAGLSLKDFQGQGLGVTIPTAYPQPFWPEEVAEILGITPGFLLGGATGGAGAVSLLGGMSAAINSGIIDLALVSGASEPIYLKGFGERSDPSYGPRAGSDALVMGVKDAGRVAMEMAGVKHSDINFLQLYDDYIIVVYLQIEDLGFCAKGDVSFYERTDFTFKGQLPIQTGGGMINVGQPSTAGGTLHIIEGVRQLRGEG